MFATEAIVLKKSHIRDSEFLYHLFTRDFWKIRVWTNKKKCVASVDHGSILQCLISTKSGKNTMESMKIKRVIHPENLDYQGLTNILTCLRSTSLLHPEGISNTSLFDDYLSSLPYFECRDTNTGSIEYFLFKMLKNGGMLGKQYPKETIESADFKKIYNNIDRYPLSTFHTMRGVQESVIEEIRRANQMCLAAYIA